MFHGSPSLRMEHPQSQSQYPPVPSLPAHEDHNGGEVGPGEGQVVTRSMSHQDLLGRAVAGAGLPPDLEQLSHPLPLARSTENLLAQAQADTGLKYGAEAEMMFPQQQMARVRLPFPPVPNVEQLPASSHPMAPSVPEQLHQHQHHFPATSGFGSIATNHISQAQQVAANMMEALTCLTLVTF